MDTTATLYDKTGAAFKLDHEHNGTLYVRPIVKVVMKSTNYHGDDFHEEEDFEPADYIVAKDDAELFYAPPIQAVEAELVAKQAELSKMKADASKALDAIRSEKQKAEWELSTAKRQLEEWMKTHKGMIDLGKLLDGKVLYPLSARGFIKCEDPSQPELAQFFKLTEKGAARIGAELCKFCEGATHPQEAACLHCGSTKSWAYTTPTN